MTELWRRLLEMEMEGLNSSKREPSLKVLEGSSAPEKQEIALKGSDGSTEVSAESLEKVPDQGEKFKPPTALVADLAHRIRKTMIETEISLNRHGENSMTRHSARSFIDG